MSKRVLNVGQCALDHSNISDLLLKHFEVEIDRASTHDEAISLCENNQYDLVLVNRLYDMDRSPGQSTVEQLCAKDSESPVMLISNFDDAQDAAVEAGATRGFGKAALGESSTLETLQQFLQ